MNNFGSDPGNSKDSSEAQKHIIYTAIAMECFESIYPQDLDELIEDLKWLKKWRWVLGGKLIEVRTFVVDDWWENGLGCWTDLLIAESLVDAALHDLALAKRYVDEVSPDMLFDEETDAIADIVEGLWQEHDQTWDEMYELLDDVGRRIEEVTVEAKSLFVPNHTC